MIKQKLYMLPAVAAAIISLLTLPGCFTGIEGTAKIKDKSSNKHQAELSPEQALLQSAQPLSPEEWTVGKRFIITEGRFELAFAPSTVASTLQPGDTIYFCGINSALQLTGDSVSDIIFETQLQRKLTYRVDVPISRILKDNRLHIPFTIDADVVESTRQILVGRNVWPLKPGKDGLRYKKSTVTNVVAGNCDYPLNVVLNECDTVKMLIEGNNSTSRIFSNLFSLSDPRKNYPQITDSHWNMVCKGKVTAGMTRNECRLSLGAPAAVERITAYNGLVEHWSYENGVYLNFLDGILTSFRE